MESPARSLPETAERPYRFHGRLTAKFPSQVIIDITEVCNLACSHCPHPEFKRSAHYAARHLDPDLNRKMVDEVRDHGKGLTQYIRYTSEGEPLIHPEGCEMVEHAVRYSEVPVTLTTNGTLLDERRTRKLLDAGLHLIDISIDAFKPETYEKIRRKGDLALTRANVLRLIEWAHAAEGVTKVVVSYVEQPENRAETKEFESFWNEQGVDYVVIRRLHSGAGALQDVARNMRKSNENKTRRPCVYPWERIVLNPRGHLAFCPADWRDQSSLVDYRDTTIRETWRGETYRKLREAHLTNSYENHAFCGGCPDWESIRWPHEGRAYADMVQELDSPS